MSLKTMDLQTYKSNNPDKMTGISLGSDLRHSEKIRFSPGMMTIIDPIDQRLVSIS
jgi:hypothetical protein